MATNTTSSTASMTKLNKTFYDRQLLESARTRFVHTKFGQKRPVPAHSGKVVEFRRWNLFDPKSVMNGLEEGVTPESQALSQTSIEARINQYGAYVEVSDLLNLTGYDQVISDSAELLGEQLGTVLEWVTRDELCTGTNVQYANNKSSRFELSPTDKLTVDEIRKAVRSLKKAKARMFSDDGRKPHYICICSPEATYDLQSDPAWQDVSKYSNAEQIYSGEIGRLFGVVFVESTEAKVFKATVNTTADSGSSATDVKLSTPLTKEQSDYLKNHAGSLTVGQVSGKNLNVEGLNAGSDSLKFSETLGSSPSKGAKIFSDDAGAEGCDVHATLVFGKDAYGVVDVEGRGAVETIIKPCGSAGTGDPLDQRATVGAKVMAFAAKVLNDLWIVRIEHGVSA